ncbi:MAG TPA: hypothetical protein VKA46_15045 [Gemmataceae bacterium]|nr:hypothetical protein [Gemmataceae bacterium]
MTQPSAIPVETPRPAPPHGSTAPAIAPEVHKFAAESGIAPYLPAIVDFTRRVFPRGEMTVELAEDHVTEGDWFILFGVDVTDLTAGELVAAQSAWSHGIFEHCPSTHTHLFRYSLRVRS